MKKFLTLFLIAILPLSALLSQSGEKQTTKPWQSFLYVDGGIIYPEGEIRESVSIRQNISYYYVNQYSSGYVSSETSGAVASLRYGYYFPRLKGGISTGVRFTGLNTEICGYTSDISDFFYLRYSMEGSDTKFARVKSLSESRYYISLPLEATYEPISYRNLTLYIRAGIEYSLLSMGPGAAIEFRDEEMVQYEKAILEQISEPVNTHFSTLYSAIGFRFGQVGVPGVMIEFYLPSAFLSKDNFALIDVKYYEGFKLAFQVPLN